MLDELHKWEKVQEEIGHRGDPQTAALTFRMRVPGGWIYLHTTLWKRTFRRDELHKSMVFVPDRNVTP